jgi:hypothetical protein
VVLFSGASDPAWCAPRGRMVRVLTTPDLNDLEIAAVLAAALGVVRQCPRPVEDNALPKTASKASASGARG